MANTRMLAILGIGLMVCSANVVKALPIGTAFTYQGFLKDAGTGKPKPANGEYDFRFSLYDDPTAGNPQGSTVDVNDFYVIDGYFVVELDFGGNIFTGDRRWLETTVRRGESNDPCDFVTLSPRLEVTLTPYAIYAKTAGSITNGSGIQDAIVRGFELTYNSTVDIYIEPGTLFHGNTVINKTTRTHLVLAVASHWWDGSIHSYDGGAGWCYIGVRNNGDIRFLGANLPYNADTAGNTEGTRLYWYDGSNYWRVVGAVRVDTSDEVAARWFQQGNIIMWDVPANITTTHCQDWSSALSCSAGMPAISEVGLFGLYAYANGSSGATVHIRPHGFSWSTDSVNGIMVGQEGYGTQVAGQRWCATDSLQQINYRNIPGAPGSTAIDIEGYVLNIR